MAPGVSSRGAGSHSPARAHREAEYQRALSDYRSLMRHRSQTHWPPCAGNVQCLRDLRNLPREKQLQLIDAVSASVARQERVALRLSPVRTEEASHEGRPRLQPQDSPRDEAHCGPV